MYATRTQVLLTQLGTAFPHLSRHLDPRDIQRIGRAGDRRLLQTGEELVRDGVLPGLVLVLRGRLAPACAAPPEHRSVLGAGEALGLEVLVGRPPRHTSLRALELCEVHVLDPATWASLAADHPTIAVGFLRALSRELAAEVDALEVTLAGAHP